MRKRVVRILAQQAAQVQVAVQTQAERQVQAALQHKQVRAGLAEIAELAALAELAEQPAQVAVQGPEGLQGQVVFQRAISTLIIVLPWQNWCVNERPIVTALHFMA